jgi:hypothetical protein
MANSIPKKRAKAEQLRKKRAQAASVLAQGAKTPVATVSHSFSVTAASCGPR